MATGPSIAEHPRLVTAPRAGWDRVRLVDTRAVLLILDCSFWAGALLEGWGTDGGQLAVPVREALIADHSLIRCVWGAWMEWIFGQKDTL